MKGSPFVFCLALLLACFTAGCRETPVCALDLSPSLRLATTTSVDNSGLLAYLLPHFEERTGIRVDVIAVGSGNALRLAENGDVDAILVHSPRAEEEFVARGAGVNRRSVMYNEFVLVGPPRDPAGIRGLGDASSTLELIRNTQATFVSRADSSGTHIREQELWEASGQMPETGEHYVETGQGMAPTLVVASERQAYCLTDIATFLTHRQQLDLEVLVQGDPRLRNPYHVLAVNPQRHPQIRYLEAMLLIGWLTSPPCAELIRSFTQDGQVLFVPDPSADQAH